MIQTSRTDTQKVTEVSDQIVLTAQVAMGTAKTDIQEAFQRRARAEAGVTPVAFDGAEVMLGGAVHSRAERSPARRTARATPGVHRVIDHMTVVD